MAQLRRRIGRYVYFTSPVDGTKSRAETLDEVWVPEPETFGEQAPMSGWGEYALTGQLLQWEEDGSRTVRLTYWRRPPGGGENDWRFGGQTTVHAELHTMKELLEKVLNTRWFEA